MLNEDQRRENYAYQPVAIGGFDSAKRDWQPTPAQSRRLRKKANKAKGDAPRSRKQRKAEQAKQALIRILERSKKRLQDSEHLTEAQAEVMGKALESAHKESGEIPIPAEFKSLCPKEWCEPFAPEFACRTKSGKKTRDHAGRVR